MPLIQWRSAPTPVTISEQATGVTEGKLETQSSISTPRSTNAPKLGARPASIALRSDIGEDQLLAAHVGHRWVDDRGRRTSAATDPANGGRGGPRVCAVR